MSMTTVDTQRRRLLFVAAVLISFGVLTILRLAQWQVVEHTAMLRRAEDIHRGEREIAPRRGMILDRNGNILAVSLRSDLVKGDPERFQQLGPKEKERTLAVTSELLGIPREQILSMLSGEGHYVALKRNVPISVTIALREASLAAIGIDEGTRRLYIGGPLASQLIGFVNAAGSGIGIEGSYNAVLTGITGTQYLEFEDYGRGIAYVPSQVIPVRDGANVYLTIDMYIQYMAERELERVLKAEKSLTGTVVILDVKTAEILAAAGRPTFDPNAYGDVPLSVHNNPVVSSPWEPGSIFKILTMAAALEAKAIAPTSVFADKGKITVSGITISNLDGKAFGNITPAQILQHSSNVGMVQIVQLLGQDRFYEFMRKFGISRLTGVDLPGEVPGMLRMPGDPLWHTIDLATQSYGQGVQTTPLQMATSIACVANQGVLMRPHAVLKIEGAGGTEVPGPQPVRKVISPETARTLTNMLVSVVDTTVTQAKVPGYRLAGKTGTASIPTASGYDEKDVSASFVGYGPADDPQFLILIRIERPQVHKSGAEAAAPAFRNMAHWLLTYYKIPPDMQAAR